LEIPAELQKNATEESIPLLPGLEALLLETHEEQRTGWVFNPVSLTGRFHRAPRTERPDAEWVAKVVSRIGKKAGVVVEPANEAKGTPAKFASAHDLRRSCAQRLDDAGLPEMDVMRVMRHRQRETLRRHYAPGTVQKSAQRIRAYLGITEPANRRKSSTEICGADT
jgi:integrase